ncbi:MAG TPA: hypothetical protein VJX30_01495 [Terriglobales bacterium]|jgi:hypothetical protein|nr:hypothetical protein [Terriglobales bacterium]
MTWTEDGTARVTNATSDWLLDTFGIRLSPDQRAKLWRIIAENSQAQAPNVDGEVD